MMMRKDPRRGLWLLWKRFGIEVLPNRSVSKDGGGKVNEKVGKWKRKF